VPRTYTFAVKQGLLIATPVSDERIQNIKSVMAGYFSGREQPLNILKHNKTS